MATKKKKKKKEKLYKVALWILFVIAFAIVEGIIICSIAKGAVIYNSFNSGELSFDITYRVDTDKRYMGVQTLNNMLIKTQGLAFKRPGTEYIDDVNDANHPVRLIPFEYAATDSYVLEFGHNYIGFFRTVND